MSQVVETDAGDAELAGEAAEGEGDVVRSPRGLAGWVVAEDEPPI
jgi:hypothetical protein